MTKLLYIPTGLFITFETKPFQTSEQRTLTIILEESTTFTVPPTSQNIEWYISEQFTSGYNTHIMNRNDMIIPLVREEIEVIYDN